MNKRAALVGLVYTLLICGILLLLLILVVSPINNTTADYTSSVMGMSGLDGFVFSNLNLFWFILLLLLAIGGIVYNSRT